MSKKASRKFQNQKISEKFGPCVDNSVYYTVDYTVQFRVTQKNVKITDNTSAYEHICFRAFKNVMHFVFNPDNSSVQNMSKKQRHQEQQRPRQHRIDLIQVQYQTNRILHRSNYSIYLVGIYQEFSQNLPRIHFRKKQKKDFMVVHIFVHCVLSKIHSEKVHFHVLWIDQKF